MITLPPCPHELLADYFETDTLAGWREWLLTAMRAASSPHRYAANSRADVYFEFAQLEGVLCAAWWLSHVAPSPQYSSTPSTLQDAQRSLRSFFRCQPLDQWLQLLHTLRHHCLQPAPLPLAARYTTVCTLWLLQLLDALWVWHIQSRWVAPACQCA
ncbi:MAG: hypothetical protein NTW29_12365 [Bacteroidetes bacterium]|nr:hypothetical protein [Bacteroidota bacterium]